MDSPPEASDVYSLSDHLLAERLQFVKEIGFGNWGSVWLCRPKSPAGKQEDVEVAVKLVHRSKTSTTAARVRSLWNEMKIVRSFKHDPHPSIIPFHSFIITPSYALITMAFLPTLVPVEVSEPRAKKWFKSLLSGVHFLHSRGVVHNDIKPANILLSRSNIPVLVDFGFAEKYDLSSPKAFHSNLTYGTPEYLSPERARGMPHDTRKSDIWSLGVTFFEILIGRTPFEYEEGEVFEKKEDLEKYWGRTIRGKWVGKYTMSPPAERFLKRMIVPNADLRCTAAQAMDDVYWDAPTDVVAHGHKKSVSAAVSVNSHIRSPSFFESMKVPAKEKEKELSTSRLLDISLPWSASRSTSRSPASTSRSPSANESASRSASRAEFVARSASRLASDSTSASRAQTPERPAEVRMSTVAVPERTLTYAHSRSKSQPKLRSPPDINSSVHVQGHRRKLSTVQASPVVKPARQIDSDVEHVNVNDSIDATGVGRHGSTLPHTLQSSNSISSIRRPLGPRQPSPRGIGTLLDAKSQRHPLAHVTHLQDHTNAHSRPSATICSRDALATRSPQTPRAGNEVPQTPFHTAQTSQTANSHSKQLSGKPPRSRSRVGVFADLTGFARNVDLTAHGVGRPTKREDRKERPVKGREQMKRGNKENGPVTRTRGGEKEVRVPFATLGSPNRILQNVDNSATSPSITANISGATTVTKGSVRDRMMDWERERERLREMERLADTSVDGEGDRESTVLTRSRSALSSEEDHNLGMRADVVAGSRSSDILQRTNAKIEKKEVNTIVEMGRPASSYTTTTAVSAASADKGQIEVAKTGVRASAQILSSRNVSMSVLGLNPATERKMSGGGENQNARVTDMDLPTETRRTSESALSGLKHSVKASIDKGFRLCKSSTLGQLTGHTTPVWCASPEPIDFEERRSGEEGRFSWENIKPEQEIAVDRMNLWIQSVEKVVEETRQNFASRSVTPPAALPLSPISRSSSQQCATQNNTSGPQNLNASTNTARSSRLPRRLLAANEIFAEPTGPDAPLSPGRMETSCIEDQSTSFSYITAPDSSVPVLPSLSVLMQTPRTPRRQRRATISTRSPTQVNNNAADDGVFDSGSPSKRREKSKSQGNLDRHIRDVAKLELELSKDPVSAPSPRLSAVLDRSLFIATPVSPRCTFPEDATTPALTRGRSIQFDDLNASPYHVEPYPPRKSGDQVVLNSPDKRRVEGVYDRFLMATAGVKRVGKGYQSDNLKPVHNQPNTSEHMKSSTSHSRTFGVFGSTKRAMPPPVSSEDQWRQSRSMDEFGFVSCSAGANANSSSRVSRDEGKNTATFVRRAFKAMVPGKTVSRRLSRTIVS